MNKLFLLFLLFVTTAMAAQPGRDGHPRGERSERITSEQRAERFARIKAARQAYITEELELTPKQAAAFFPVYWDYEQRMGEGKREGRPGQVSGEMTEKEARTELLNRRTHKQQMFALTQEAEDKFLEILPATKVIRLPDVEREFRKKLWEISRRQR